MSYQIQPLREFLVRPALPANLSRLLELSYNLLWSWDHTIRALFRRLDPVLWKESNHNPIQLLGRVSQEKLDKAAADPRFVSLYRRACERHDSYLHTQAPDANAPQIAYFSMEYGLLDCMQIYSGGLGILSGDHLKAASDGDFALYGVGLLYQRGYFQQSLNPDGWQQERTPVNDFYTLPVRPCIGADGKEVIVSVTLPSGEVFIKVWHIDVGRVKLFVLDTNIPQNHSTEHREITDQLYGGDIHKRIRQEIVLGIGGLRALKELGIKPTVHHMNEGHSAFLAIERVRLLMAENGLTFEQALEATRLSNVFTTHTSVPAGIDLFDNGLVYEYFGHYCHQAGIPFEKMLTLGRNCMQDPSERFSMAVFALKTSAFRNAVSVLHRSVSQEMFQDLWPRLPVEEVPITSITNGVHSPTWINGDLAVIYDQYLQPDWRERLEDSKMWEFVHEIPNQELWEMHRKRKRRMVSFVRERAAASAIQRKAAAVDVRQLSEVLDPDVFTIGFARRFATYKRATLIFRDAARLKKLLSNPKMPVQIVIAGKAHPKDNEGKKLIREIVTLSRDPEIAKRLIFVEDYSIAVAREMVQSVDLWLNNPRRGEEACGTSGMKASMNGVLNFSVLDGWFDEAYEVSGGWAIGDRVEYSEDQNDIHASTIYSTLENDIVPLYYQRSEQEIPTEWVRRMKTCIANITPKFSCGRMVAEYMSELYQPAHQLWGNISKDNFGEARQKTVWDSRMSQYWDAVRFVDLGDNPGDQVLSGSSVPVRATVDLAGLEPSEVRVEAVIGQIGVNGQLQSTFVLPLSPVAENGSAVTFANEFTVQHTGRVGYSVRIGPNHFDNPVTRPCNALLKWVSDENSTSHR
ncbi:MAG: alpha-glucan family phosphorylase [Acidobacteriaceae bacterium]|nr:alpha-glucan family phosphorylase [Acidobacteriaceae bacterium]MBV9939668.1 alpha-glucan family phosphorylase [Acidobacteriaceae bacterium]